MIAFLRGKVFAIEEESIVVETGGFGISVMAPLAMMRPLPAVGEEIFLHTHLQVREDGWLLFGFPNHEQLEIFRYLLSVSGIGAKTSLAIVNALSADKIAAACSKGDYNSFCTVSGVGKKTAQRIVLELKDKFAKWQGTETAEDFIPDFYTDQDLLDALVNLGFGAAESRALAAKATAKLGKEADTNSLIKEALRMAAKF